MEILAYVCRGIQQLQVYLSPKRRKRKKKIEGAR
jgi:hypothetical protein